MINKFTSEIVIEQKWQAFQDASLYSRLPKFKFLSSLKVTETSQGLESKSEELAQVNTSQQFPFLWVLICVIYMPLGRYVKIYIYIRMI